MIKLAPGSLPMSEDDTVEASMVLRAPCLAATASRISLWWWHAVARLRAQWVIKGLVSLNSPDQATMDGCCYSLPKEALSFFFFCLAPYFLFGKCLSITVRIFGGDGGWPDMSTMTCLTQMHTCKYYNICSDYRGTLYTSTADGQKVTHYGFHIHFNILS